MAALITCSYNTNNNNNTAATATAAEADDDDEERGERVSFIKLYSNPIYASSISSRALPPHFAITHVYYNPPADRDRKYLQGMQDG